MESEYQKGSANYDFSTLESGLKALGLRSDSDVLDAFAKYHSMIVSWNRRVNLTAVVDWESAVLRHFLDSAAVSIACPFQTTEVVRVLDVGSGAGFPGIPLKIIFPSMNLVLLDSVRKKTRYLEYVCDKLKFEHVQVLTGRAENVSRNTGHRESYDIVASRAVAEMNVLLELTLPFCRLGGTLVAMKGDAIKSELERAEPALRRLGGELVEVVKCSDRYDFMKGSLVIISKVSPTPAKFPRRAGIPSKRPLLK